MQNKVVGAAWLGVRRVQCRTPSRSLRVGLRTNMTISARRPSILFLDDIDLAQDEYAALAKDVDIQVRVTASR